MIILCKSVVLTTKSQFVFFLIFCTTRSPRAFRVWIPDTEPRINNGIGGIHDAGGGGSDDILLSICVIYMGEYTCTRQCVCHRVTLYCWLIKERMFRCVTLKLIKISSAPLIDKRIDSVFQILWHNFFNSLFVCIDVKEASVENEIHLIYVKSHLNCNIISTKLPWGQWTCHILSHIDLFYAMLRRQLH